MWAGCVLENDERRAEGEVGRERGGASGAEAGEGFDCRGMAGLRISV